jgi:hypothetical protein
MIDPNNFLQEKEVKPPTKKGNGWGGTPRHMPKPEEKEGMPQHRHNRHGKHREAMISIAFKPPQCISFMRPPNVFRIHFQIDCQGNGGVVQYIGAMLQGQPRHEEWHSRTGFRSGAFVSYLSCQTVICEALRNWSLGCALICQRRTNSLPQMIIYFTVFFVFVFS